MIISHKHKFIYIKLRKTAGTSIEMALSKICGENDILTPLIDGDDEPKRQEYANRGAQNYKINLNNLSKSQLIHLHQLKMQKDAFFGHMPAKIIKKFVSEEVWNSYYKFTVERNPFDKVVSYYYYHKGNEKYPNITEFIRRGGLVTLNPFHLYSIHGMVVMDHIYKYENLTEFLDHFSNKINLKEKLEMPKYKAKSHTRLVQSYQDMLDEEAVELIKLIYAREIQLMNYKF